MALNNSCLQNWAIFWRKTVKKMGSRSNIKFPSTVLETRYRRAIVPSLCAFQLPVLEINSQEERRTWFERRPIFCTTLHSKPMQLSTLDEIFYQLRIRDWLLSHRFHPKIPLKLNFMKRIFVKTAILALLPWWINGREKMTRHTPACRIPWPRHAYTHTYTRMHTHAHAQTYTCTHTHTHKHTHKHTHTSQVCMHAHMHVSPGVGAFVFVVSFTELVVGSSGLSVVGSGAVSAGVVGAGVVGDDVVAGTVVGRPVWQIERTAVRVAVFFRPWNLLSNTDRNKNPIMPHQQRPVLFPSVHLVMMSLYKHTLRCLLLLQM